MSLISQNHLTISPSRFFLHLTKTHFKNPNFPLPNSPNFPALIPDSLKSHNLKPIRAFQSDRPYTDDFNLDAVLSIAEVVCLASSAIITIGSSLNFALTSSQKPILAWLGTRVSVWQYVLILSGVVIGAVIRKRQWMKICMDFSKPDGSGVNLFERIEKLEEEIRSSVTIVRVLSRKVEKLGIQFRVSRRALKDPIAEAIALAQNNSEATGSLTVQEKILEKEIVEIQKFLLAMQDQQQKQLELICAIGETGKLFEEKKEQSHKSTIDEDLKQMQVNLNSI